MGVNRCNHENKSKSHTHHALAEHGEKALCCGLRVCVREPVEGEAWVHREAMRYKLGVDVLKCRC